MIIESMQLMVTALEEATPVVVFWLPCTGLVMLLPIGCSVGRLPGCPCRGILFRCLSFPLTPEVAILLELLFPVVGLVCPGIFPAAETMPGLGPGPVGIFPVPGGLALEQQVLLDAAGLYTLVSTLIWCWVNDVVLIMVLATVGLAAVVLALTPTDELVVMLVMCCC